MLNFGNKRNRPVEVDIEPDEFEMPSGPSHRRQQANEIGAWFGMTLIQVMFYFLLIVAIATALHGGK